MSDEQVASNPQSILVLDLDNEDDFVCKFCNNFYDTPRVLECGHLYCEKCIKVIFGFSVLQSFEICTSKINIPKEMNEEWKKTAEHIYLQFLSCPNCFKPSKLSTLDAIEALEIHEAAQKGAELHRNRKTTNVCGWCEQQQAKLECEKCEIAYCDECRNETHQRPAFKSHQFNEIGEKYKKKFKICAKHSGKKKNIFCKTCNQTLCSFCKKFEKTHDNHVLIAFSEANTLLQKNIDLSMARYQFVLDCLKAYQRNMGRSNERLQHGYKKFEEEVKRKFSEVRAYIDDRENQLLSFVKYRTDEDQKLGKIIKDSADLILNYSEEVSKLPNDAPIEAPEYLIEFNGKLDKLTQALEDIQMESSLFPARFDFNVEEFKEKFESNISVFEQLDLAEPDSAIINSEMKEIISGWLSKCISGVKECSLIYRASYNGWNDTKFHEITDKIRDPILIIGKSEGGCIFGGFQSGPWKKTNSFSGLDSFLFSLSRDNGNELKPICCENLFKTEGKLPNQYSPRDLYFQLNTHLVFSQLGHCFKIPHHESADILLGSSQCKLTELEMFCIGNPPTRGPKMKEILRGHPQLKKILTDFLQQQFNSSNLLYKASRDGWFSNVFHSKCDDKAPTLVLVKSELGHIFGGFNKKPWGNKLVTPANKGFIHDPDAFLFSLTDGQGRPPFILKLQNAKAAILNDNRAGPCYGGGPDIKLCLDEQVVQCNPHSYSIPTGHRQDTFLAGHTVARVDEVEVYLL